MVRCTVAPLRKLNKIIVKGNLIWTFVFAHSFLSPGNIAQGIFIWTFFARLFLSPGNIAQDLDFLENSYLFPGNTAQGILILSCLSSPKHLIFYQYHFSFLVLFLFANFFEIVAENIGWSVSQLQSSASPPKVVCAATLTERAHKRPR